MAKKKTSSFDRLKVWAKTPKGIAVIAAGRALQKPRKNTRQRKYKLEKKEAAIKMYGGRCKCCGEKELIFLTMDHVDGGGRQERLAVNMGSSFYTYLLRMPKSPRFQVLCFNCNCGRHINGGVCPHKTQTNKRLTKVN